MTPRPKTRCAVYTRKSSEEGLDQDFNSLDAQFEACAAFVASQRQEGWTLLSTRYDDGGLSGGTLDRPALQRLLSDVDAGRIDRIVVYKIDRLTRSLSDFSKIVDRLDAAGCSFVSVTQSFNTATSMGRLTLNMLLSFAQFEREVTAERIRDKIAASKKKGLWMGGTVPLGYDRHPNLGMRQLVVNAREAETVKKLFQLYDRFGCLRKVTAEAARLGLRSKRRVYGSGRKRGGNPFSRGQIYYLLRNPTYLGKIRHKDKTFPGQHAAVIEESLWARVQRKLQAASARPRGASTAKARGGNPAAPSLLAGKIRDETGDILTPTHTKRHDRRLRYYVSNRLISAGPDPAGWRLPAPAFEATVTKMVAAYLQHCVQRHSLLAAPDIRAADRVATSVATLIDTLRSAPEKVLPNMISSGHLETGKLHIELGATQLAQHLDVPADAISSEALNITSPFALRRRGIEMKIVAGETEPCPDPVLISTLHKAHRWTESLRNGTPLTELAQQEKVSPSYLRTRAQLAFLSPALQKAILNGQQPQELTVKSILSRPLPLDWNAQAICFGFTPAGSLP
ncbi:recombinase family protein [Sulfitobacter sediminilitoris]|uniref:recombinase family protein n=1 Tax=Sulfitobacter sediminilitoris TaxID=2698830 RepID=UPI002E27EEE3|nr:recombinase family protein [Sulfitobacter sediminilitoris]